MAQIHDPDHRARARTAPRPRRWLMGLVLGAAGCVGEAPPLPEMTSAPDASTTDELDEDSTTSAESTSSEASSSDDGGQACGNGVLDPGEVCDDQGESPQCDADCTDPVCGDLTLNVAAGEQCDGALASTGETCESLGFDGGQLACDGGCAYDTNACLHVPSPAPPTLGFSAVRQFEFSWAAVEMAESYQLLESPTAGAPYEPIGDPTTETSLTLTRPVHLRHDASYVLRACNEVGCGDAEPLAVSEPLVEPIGYVKASNPHIDRFGTSVAMSADGLTLAVGAPYEDSGALGIGGNQADDSATSAGAVYVFVGNGRGTWTQQAYVKASNTDADDHFGYRVALSDDGDTLVVGAPREGSSATGVGGNQADDSLHEAGAVYVFGRDGAGTWAQQAYVKASNAGGGDPVGDRFGEALALSGDGTTLAVGAPYEDSDASTIGGPQGDDGFHTGAVYVFRRSGAGAWAQQAYVKASNAGTGDGFGTSVALSDDGDTLAVGARYENGGSPGVGGDQTNDVTSGAGAAYVFTRNIVDHWSQAAYVKASNPGEQDRFGTSVALSGDGQTLAVGAIGEASGGIDPADDAATGAGAVYVFALSGQWAQQAYIKARNPDAGDEFGIDLALDTHGDTLAVGAWYEDNVAAGVGAEPIYDFSIDSGAVYLYTRDDADDWTARSYVKAPNTDANDGFGSAVALDGEGTTLAAAAPMERGGDAGIGGDQHDDSLPFAGAVYLY